ncbi:AAA family ATPase [Rhizobium puerariae]|uniref:AAA family ATPase n=1 Tax=Rhizobium puerariae TaxID=1585791 RepID=A0ABV6AFN4_9HYPH
MAMNEQPLLVLVSGLPGSGKTTLAQKLETELGAIRMSPDEWMTAFAIDLYDSDRRERIESFQLGLALKLLERGQAVIIEWGTWSRSERDALRIAAQRSGARVHLHFLHASADILFERLQKRGMENPPIPYGDVLKWFDVIEIPSEDEVALYDHAAVGV